MKTYPLLLAFLFFIFSLPAYSAVSDSVIISHYYTDAEDDTQGYGLSSRTETHLDSLGRTSYIIYQYWNGNQFTNGHKLIYTYDSLGREIDALSQREDGNSWINESHTYHYYNSFQAIDSIVNYSWINSAWETVSGSYFTYDLNQHLILTDNGTTRVNYYPDSSSHDTLEIQSSFIANAWRSNYMYRHSYDSLGRKASTVKFIFYVIDTTWYKNDSTAYRYYPDDSLFMQYEYYWYDSLYIFADVDSIVYSNDTMYTYSAQTLDSTGFPVYEYRDVLYLPSTQYVWYESEYEYWDGTQWWPGDYSDQGSYDSTLNIAHSHYTGSGSWGTTDSYFDTDGHEINTISTGYIHGGDTYYNSETFYYYYLTHGDPGLCPGATDSLWIDTGMISYSWNTGETLNYILVSTDSLYFCNLVNQYGHPFQSEPHYQYVTLSPTAPREPDSTVTSCKWDQLVLAAPDLPIYSYQWLRNDTAIPGESSSAINFWVTLYAPQVSGDYTLVVSNECGSDTSSTTHIIFHVPDVSIDPDSGYVYLCPGDTIVLTADSGFASYLWNTGETAQTVFSTFGHINYHLTVQDVYGCADYEDVNVDEVISPNYLPLTITQQDTILQSSLSDSRPYFQWFLNGVPIPGAIYQQYHFLQSGFYKFQYSISGCMFESIEEYFEYTSFSITVFQNPVNKCINSVTILSNFYQLHDGTAPFHYSWSPATGLNSDTVAAPLCTINTDTDYILTVTDSLGNTVSDTFHVHVNQPVTLDISAALGAICPNYYGGPNSDTLTCNTLLDGYYIWYMGGSSFYSGVNRTTATTTSPGQYSLQVSNGCVNYSDTVTIAALPNPPVPVFHFVTIPSDWCAIDSLALVAEVPNPELYEFEWSLYGVYNIPNDTIYLPDARYVSAKISDSLGCTTQASFNATLYIPDTIIPVDLIPDGLVTACLGDTIQLVATNYTNFNYEWHNYDNDLLSTISTCDVIYSGQYFVSADNGFGCHGIDSVFLSFNLNPVTVQVSYDGYYLVATSSQYTNHWQWYLNDTLIPGATNSSWHPIEAGNYEAVAATGSCGSGIDSFLVNCAVGILADQISCNQACDGSASLNISGGGVYDIVWSTGDTIPAIQNLCPGIYWVQVSDSAACFSSDTLALTEPDLLIATSAATMNLCYQSCDGTAQALVSGGTQPYSYLWSTGETGAAIDSLCAGNYAVQVLDAQGCISSDTVALTQPTQLSSTSSANMNSCYQSCDGAITIAATGGTQPYIFTWSTNDTTPAIDSLCPGNYSYMITDANGCSWGDSVLITEPSEIILSDTVTDASCAVCPDGSVVINFSGGTPPYAVLWSTNDTTTSLINILPGDYSVCITDSAGCLLCDTFTVGMMVSNDFHAKPTSTLNIFPNPVNELLNIACTSDQKNEKVYLSLRNELGEIVYPAVVFENQVSVDVSALPNGVYMLELRKETDELMQWKVVVVH